MTQRLANQRLAALFVAGWLLLSYPLLSIWGLGGVVWGLPAFPVALFLIWLALIGALAWVAETTSEEPGAGNP